MTVFVLGFLLLGAWLAVWSYLLYPPCIRLLSTRRAPRPESGGTPPSVEVLVAAADEEAVIADRVRDLLAQRVTAPYSISIACDGCADRTAERAREAAGGDARVRVVEFPARRGKASALNDLVTASRADVLVFTDANTRFDPGAVECLARALADPRVGAACGRLILEAAGGAATPESVFWERETRSKEAEGSLGVCLGANGAVYAARRASVEPLPADTAMDDFLIPARIAGRGQEVIFAGDAVARESLPTDVREEFSRRFRIGIGAGQVLRRERWLWSFGRRPLLAFVFFSRKAARWLGPVAVLLAMAAALGSSALRPWGLAALGLAGLLAVSTLWRLRPGGVLWRLYYFGVINLALASGVLAGLLGYRRPAWKRTRSPG
jgi:cellulose synthase/poly-beta-1,6-N-acetylglucosamine synthase-like glycosyltransferase